MDVRMQERFGNRASDIRTATDPEELPRRSHPVDPLRLSQEIDLFKGDLEVGGDRKPQRPPPSQALFGDRPNPNTSPRPAGRSSVGSYLRWRRGVPCCKLGLCCIATYK